MQESNRQPVGEHRLAMKTTSTALGHSTARVTLDRYAPLYTEDLKQLAESFHERFRSSADQRCSSFLRRRPKAFDTYGVSVVGLAGLEPVTDGLRVRFGPAVLSGETS